MNILCVVAHPDDESLFMGATIACLAKSNAVFVRALSNGTSSRHGSTVHDTEQREAQFHRACYVLGATGSVCETFPDQQSDAVPQLQINRQVELSVDAIAPTAVYTHHVGDLNIDHRRVAEAVLVATRGLSCDVFSMAPEWPDRCVGQPWNPRIRMDIGVAAMDAKLKACACYVDELRPYPHPRSLEAIRQQEAEWFQAIP